MVRVAVTIDMIWLKITVPCHRLIVCNSLDRVETTNHFMSLFSLTLTQQVREVKDEEKLSWLEVVGLQGLACDLRFSARPEGISSGHPCTCKPPVASGFCFIYPSMRTESRADCPVPEQLGYFTCIVEETSQSGNCYDQIWHDPYRTKTDFT